MMSKLLPHKSLTLLLLWIGLSFVLLFYQEQGSANEISTKEYRLKAAFLYNFLKFVEWPKQQNTSDFFSVCIIGHDPFGDTLTPIEQKNIDGKAIKVIPKNNSDNDFNHCNLLFVSDSEEDNLTEIMQKIKNTSVLTISEIDGFVKYGGMIEFLKESGTIRFAINNTAASKANLKISSKLLELAAFID